MNKLVILLLALCFVGCIHAFVKRDAPAAGGESTQDALKKIQDSLGELGKEFSEKASAFLNPENVKKNFNEFVDTINKGIESVKTGAQKQQ